MQCVRDFNGGGATLTQYPGSPGFALMLLREHDPLHCWELHPTDERILRATLASVLGFLSYDFFFVDPRLMVVVPPAVARNSVSTTAPMAAPAAA